VRLNCIAYTPAAKPLDALRAIAEQNKL
jgi:hypothetical protein